MNQKGTVGEGGGEKAPLIDSSTNTTMYDFSSQADEDCCDDLRDDLGGRDRLEFSGEITSEFLISEVGDVTQKNARLVADCTWEDLRTSPPDDPPAPASNLFNVWQLDRAADRPLYLDSRFMGVAYVADDSTAVLVNSVPGALSIFKPLVNLICGPPAPPPPCPTTTLLSGSGRIWSNYLPTRAAARANAIALAGPYAGVLAGLEANAFTCPNPACVGKTLGPVTAAATDIVSTISTVGSLAYLSVRYIAYVDFTWSAPVTCV